MWLNPRTYTEIHTPTVGQGRVDETPPGFFYMLQYFEMILPLVESIWSSLQDEVYFMGGGAPHLGRQLGFYQELEIRLKPR